MALGGAGAESEIGGVVKSIFEASDLSGRRNDT